VEVDRIAPVAVDIEAHRMATMVQPPRTYRNEQQKKHI
jgi:hypothetical protein